MNKEKNKAYLKELDFSKKNLRQFGVTLSICFFVLSLILFLKHKAYYGALFILSIFFVFAGLISPFILKALYIGWMIIAFVLGWINTRIILCIIFYVVITPIGLFSRLFGKNFLVLNLDKNKDTYWVRSEVVNKDKNSYRKSF